MSACWAVPHRERGDRAIGLARRQISTSSSCRLYMVYRALVDHQWQWALSRGRCASRAAVWVFAVMLLDNVMIELNRVYVKVMYIRACISSCSAVLIYEVVWVCAYGVCSCYVSEWGACSMALLYSVYHVAFRIGLSVDPAENGRESPHFCFSFLGAPFEL